MPGASDEAHEWMLVPADQAGQEPQLHEELPTCHMRNRQSAGTVCSGQRSPRNCQGSRQVAQPSPMLQSEAHRAKDQSKSNEIHSRPDVPIAAPNDPGQQRHRGTHMCSVAERWFVAVTAPRFDRQPNVRPLRQESAKALSAAGSAGIQSSCEGQSQWPSLPIPRRQCCQQGPMQSPLKVDESPAPERMLPAVE